MEPAYTLHDYQEAAVQKVLAQTEHKAALIGDEVGLGKTLMSAEILIRAGWERVLIIGIPATIPQWDREIQRQSQGKLPLIRQLESTKVGREAYKDFLAGAKGIFFANMAWLIAQDFKYQWKRDSEGKRIPQVKKSTGEYVVTDRQEGEIGPAHEPKFMKERKHLMTFKKMSERKGGHLDALIFDEAHMACFVAGKLVDTPSGPRAIESLEIGDEVYGYDHKNKRVIVTRVSARMNKESREIMPNGGTADHPYYVVGDGYRPLADLTEEDYVYKLEGQNVRAVRPSVHGPTPERGSKILLPRLLSASQVEQPREKAGDDAGAGREVRLESTGSAMRVLRGGFYPPLSEQQKEILQPVVCVEECGGARLNQGGILPPNVDPESREDPGHHREGARIPGGACAVSEGRERARNERIAISPVGRTGGRMDARVPSGDRSGCPSEGVAHELQDRFGTPQCEGGHRVRRSFTQGAVSKGERQSQGGVAVESGVDDLEILESRNPQRYDRVREANRGGSQRVYNIETESNNYFVDGILVHNCNHNSIGRRTLMTFRGEDGTTVSLWRVALSATWAGNSFDNAWSIPNWLWPLQVPSYYNWYEQYVLEAPVLDEEGKPKRMRGGKELKKVVGEKVPGEFINTLPCYIRNEAKEKAPDAIEIHLEPTPQQAAQFAQLQEDLFTWASNWKGEREPLVVDIPGVLHSRLKQVALAELALDPTGRVTFRPDAASSKLHALRAILDKWSNQPVVIFTDSKQMANLTAWRMQMAGYNAVAYTGDTKKKDRDAIKEGFIAGEIKYIIGTVQAMGTGLDGLQRVCSKAVWLSVPDGDPKLETQALGRVFRQGRTLKYGEFVHVRLLTKGTTDTEVLANLLAKARAIQGSIGAAALAA